MNVRVLKIPESDVEPLAQFRALTDEEATGLFVALRDSRLTLKRDELVEAVAAKTGLARSQVAGILRVLLTLYAVRGGHKLSTDELADLLVASAERAEHPQLKLEGESAENFRNRIRQFLSLDRSIGVVSKALDVALQHEKLLHEARIITDVRPVFSGQVSEGPAAMVITHLLKLEIHRGSSDDADEIFVAMNSTDLARLADVVRRAQQKEESLRSSLATNPIPLLTLSND